MVVSFATYGDLVDTFSDTHQVSLLVSAATEVEKAI